MLSVIFFFSSRRRHTRFDCDWSSDVCSSDLGGLKQVADLYHETCAKYGQKPGRLMCSYFTHFADNKAQEAAQRARSEEHTSELQSQSNLVCRLLLEKKKKETYRRQTYMTALY